MIEIGSENFVLVWAVLYFIAVVAGKMASVRSPALLLFLDVGMLQRIGYHLVQLVRDHPVRGYDRPLYHHLHGRYGD